MTTTDFALAVRPGEHACTRAADASDRERIATAFVRDGLDRGNKIVYLCDRGDVEEFLARLDTRDERVQGALARGQLAVSPALDFYCRDGVFDPDTMLRAWDEEYQRARAEGYPALSLTGEMTWALCEMPGIDELGRYEQGIADIVREDGGVVFLCQYDHGRFASGALAEAAATHPVDVSPELAPIGRVGCLSAARVHPGPTLRLAGELDFGVSDTVAAVLDAHYHGDLQLDLADLRFVDVAGMRALRGRKGQRLRIIAASHAVETMVRLLAWDSDPAIEMLPVGTAAAA
jgi:ABC-type transporter Mla MlaB component